MIAEVPGPSGTSGKKGFPMVNPSSHNIPSPPLPVKRQDGRPNGGRTPSRVCAEDRAVKIINKTPWSPAKLREIVRRVAAEELDPEHRKIATVIFEPRGRHRVLGYGRIGASPRKPAMVAWVYLQSPERLHKVGKGYCGREGCYRTYDAHRRITDHRFERIEVDLSLDGAEIAHVLAHEFQHNLGRRHRQMHRKYIEHDYTPWSWAGRVTLDPRTDIPPAKRAEERLTHALRMLRRAETRAKRATTILKKWRRRVRDGERRAVAMKALNHDEGRR